MKTILFILTLSANCLYAQTTDPIWVNDYYVIQPKITFKKTDAVFSNPSAMPDRIILDSTKRMVAKKVSFPFGYTYYEWKRKDGFKTYEEIHIPSVGYRKCKYFTDTGDVEPPSKNSLNASIDYFRSMPNPKFRYNGFNIAEKIYISLNKQTVDSFVTQYKISKAKLLPKTIWYSTFFFYENGHIKSTGILVTDLKEANLSTKGSGIIENTTQNQFKLGEWLYYDEQGNLMNKEVITTLKRLR